MEYTGERMTTDYESYGSIEHLHRYSIIQELLKPDMIVLDVACGEGYGTRFISQKVKKAIGVDISHEAISHAATKYKESNLEFIQASAVNIPLDDKSIDLIISFETIEHLAEHDMMLNELKRLLKKEGMLIMSTPDKEHYDNRMTNRFHVRELTFNEFRELIGRYFTITRFYFQKTIHGSLIYTENSRSAIEQYNGDFENIDHLHAIKRPAFMIAFATDNQNNIFPDSNSLFDASGIFQQEYEEFVEVKTKYFNLVSSIRFRLLNRIMKIIKMGF